MSARKDAAQSAAKIMSFARDLALHMGGQQLATVGSVHLDPSLINVVPRKATLTLDLRNPVEDQLKEAESRVIEFLEALAIEEGVGIEHRTIGPDFAGGL